MPLIKSQFYSVIQIPIFYKRNSFSIIDNLTYSYTGNRLTNIVDGVSGNEDVGDLRDAGQSTDYTYYANGSLKSDANKGISNIVYDTYLKKLIEIQLFTTPSLKRRGRGEVVQSKKKHNHLNSLCKFLTNLMRYFTNSITCSSPLI